MVQRLFHFNLTKIKLIGDEKTLATTLPHAATSALHALPHPPPPPR